MSRPRTLQLQDGTISLQGFSKEQADALSEYIKNFGKETQVAQIESGVTTVMVSAQPGVLVTSMTDSLPVSVEAPLTEKAIGIYSDRKTLKTELVTVSYNPETGHAKVENIETCDGMKHAIMKFKIAASDLNFV